jgi:hypothetical protein
MSQDFDFPDEVENFGTNPEDFSVSEDGIVRIGDIPVAGHERIDNTDHYKESFAQGRLSASEREEQAEAAREEAGEVEQDEEVPETRMAATPCPRCGREQYTHGINPLGTQGDRVIWACPCGQTRGANFSGGTPDDLIEKAQEQDEIMDLIYHHAGLKPRRQAR